MFLSMVIPVYKTEKYIRECLDSCLSQDISEDDYEIICVDDGSPDGSGAILDEYAERYNNITVIHKENGGVSSARNAGIDAAKGDYIWFIDSDDFPEFNVLKRLVSFIKSENPDKLIIGAYHMKDDELSSEEIENRKLKKLTPGVPYLWGKYSVQL